MTEEGILSMSEVDVVVVVVVVEVMLSSKMNVRFVEPEDISSIR